MINKLLAKLSIGTIVESVTNAWNLGKLGKDFSGFKSANVTTEPPFGTFPIRFDGHDGKYLHVTFGKRYDIDKMIGFLTMLEDTLYATNVNFIRFKLEFELTIDEDMKLREMMLASVFNYRILGGNYIRWCGEIDETCLAYNHYRMAKETQEPTKVDEHDYLHEWKNGKLKDQTPYGIMKGLE